MNDMRDVILGQAQQITHSLEVNRDVRAHGQFDSIILAGMGGSGHPGDLLNALHLPSVPLLVHRDYGLPSGQAKWRKKPLVIVSSYSGNTEEALSAYAAAQKEGHALLINTSGGKLQKLSQKESLPLTLIDYAGMQPRHTLFASFVGIYTALKNSGLVEDITSDLRRCAEALEATVLELEAPAKALAASLKGHTPVYTSSETLAFAAKNLKIQTNENAKTPAFWNQFPELNHNEMLGFTNPQGKFHVVILRDEDDHPRVKARMDVTKELYQGWGVEVTDVDIPGTTSLEKIFNAIIFGLWTTYYLALACSIDPIPVEGVENFKARLKEVAGEV